MRFHRRVGAAGAASLVVLCGTFVSGSASGPAGAARADISAIKTALDAFEVDNGYYPKSLADLIQQPTEAKNWHGPYLEKVPSDPWGSNYEYTYPGRHNANGYDLWSDGPDAKSGTDDDIGNWTK